MWQSHSSKLLLSLSFNFVSKDWRWLFNLGYSARHHSHGPTIGKTYFHIQTIQQFPRNPFLSLSLYHAHTQRENKIHFYMNIQVRLGSGKCVRTNFPHIHAYFTISSMPRCFVYGINSLLAHKQRSKTIYNTIYHS